MSDMPSTYPLNIIYTGVAGTGKTYQLLQIAKQYTDQLPVADNAALLTQLLEGLSWREVMCLVFLDLQQHQQDLVRVPEILVHDFFVAKAAHNARDKNLSNTAWSILQLHSAKDSQTVEYKNRASQAYFDKDDSGAWYLLPESQSLLAALAQQLAEFRQAQRDNQPLQHTRFSMVSFHQAYGYEEFVEGIRPMLGAASQTGQGSPHTQMHYDIQDGAFLQLCQRAAKDPAQRYAMLIDEINRANVSRVFGELLSLIELDKRIGQPNVMQVQLAYSNRPFSVPANVDIYATMNTQDHSLAPLDMALRRRFRFIDCPPRPELLPSLPISTGDTPPDHTVQVEAQIAYIDLAGILVGLNRRIVQTLGQEAQLGHAFLMSVQSVAQLQHALVTQLIPQLVQATGGQVGILQYLFCDDNQPYRSQFIHDAQALLEHTSQAQPPDSLSASSLFAGQSAMFGQGLGTGGYVMNTDLVTGTGEFAQPFVYQRLY